MITPARETVKLTLKIYRNLPWSYRIGYTTPEGQPIDISSYDAKLVIKDGVGDLASTLHTFSKDLGTIVLGNGFIDLLIPTPSITNSFAWREGVGHLVVGATAETMIPLVFLGFEVHNSTTDLP